jgi:hypothetical protein
MTRNAVSEVESNILGQTAISFVRKETTAVALSPSSYSAARISNMRLASSTVLAIGPIWSCVQDTGQTPPRLKVPLVGRNPTRLHAEAGLRISIS